MAWTTYSTRWQDIRTSSDAVYREFGSWISSNLTTLGWEKTADTGQIDWTTTTRPGVSNTKGGYEIRRSTGAGTDIYIKISYGNGYNTSCLGLWLQSGDGSDGAGALTGDTTTEQKCGGAQGSGTPYTSSFLLAGDTDNFVFGWTNENNVSNSNVFGIQRTCDSSGVDTTTGWFQYSFGYNGSAQAGSNQYCSFATGAATADSTVGVAILPSIVTSAQTGAIFLPAFVQDGSVYVALRDMIVQIVGSTYSQNDVPHYGSTRRFMGIGGTTANTVWGVTSPSTYWWLMRVS